MSVQNGSLDGRGLNEVLGHMGRSQIGTASLSPKLSLHVDAFNEVSNADPPQGLSGIIPFSSKIRSSNEFL